MKDKKVLTILQLAVGVIVLITFFLSAIDARVLTTNATNSFTGSDLSFGYTHNGYKMSDFNFFILILYFIPAIAGLLLTYLSERVRVLKYITLGLSLLALIGFILVIPVLFQPIGGYVYIDGAPIQNSNYTLTPGLGLIAAIIFTLFGVVINSIIAFYNQIFNKRAQ